MPVNFPCCRGQIGRLQVAYKSTRLGVQLHPVIDSVVARKRSREHPEIQGHIPLIVEDIDRTT